MSERLLTLSIPNVDAANVRLAVFDFDGVFTDNTVFISPKTGEEYVKCYRGDGMGLSKLKSAGVRTYVLSTEPSPVVKLRCEKMKVEYQQGLEDKAKALKELAGKMGVSLEATLYLGNDINDRSSLEIVGVPVIVADAFDEVRSLAKYQTQKKGGMGAVREVCDWIVKCKENEK